MLKETSHSMSLRQSNIELLRIFAMFLVLVVHANFFSLGSPTREDSINAVFPTLTRFFFQSISIGCVDIFVLISGWFGIRPKCKGFLNFVFQCLFFLCGIYIVGLILGYTKFSIAGILECFVLTKHNWFIKSYMLLYLLAPVFNSFVEKSNEKELRNTLIAFYTFQTIFGWATSSVTFFAGGYSTMSFIGLYLLARYVRLYANKWFRMSRNKDFMVFLTIVVLQAVFAYLICRFDVLGIYFPMNARIFSYINPLVILSSLYLLLFFSKLNMPHTYFINKISASCFAVFLLHQQANVVTLFKCVVRTIYETSFGLYCLIKILLFLMFLFVCAVLIDQIRLICWSHVGKKLGK